MGVSMKSYISSSSFSPCLSNKCLSPTSCTTKFSRSFLSVVAIVMLCRQAKALSPVDLKDDRKAKSLGFDLIYEARDLDLPQNIRDGISQARSSVDDTKKRVAESEKRITQEVLPLIKKAYWTEAKEALRLQVGTLRFDLNTLTDAKPKAQRSSILAAKKQLFTEIEKVDFAIREKKLDLALDAYDVATGALNVVLAELL